MVEQTGLRRLLVLHGPAFESQGLLSFLGRHFEIELAEELDDALAAMRERSFAAVLAETADFLPLERGIVTQQASIVLDTIGDGVCIVGPSGELAWANRRARDLPSATIDSLREICTKAYEDLATDSVRAGGRGKRYSLRSDQGAYYEVICSPVRDRQGVLRQVAAVIVDATTLHRQQRKLNAIDRAGRELVALESEFHKDVSERLQLLTDRIIHCSRDVLDFQNFGVLLVDEKTNRLELIISEGLGDRTTQNELFVGTEGNGICGYVAATGRSYICGDVGKDKRYLPGLTGARSSLTVPLRLYDKVIGVFNVESDRVNAFSEEDRQFAEIFGNYVALALHILNLLVSERQTAHSQVSGSICTELTAPLNDIAAEASGLMEDYIGHDDLRGRLGAILEMAFMARQSVQRYAQSPSAAVLKEPDATDKKDPTLEGKTILVADDEELMRHTIRDVLVARGCEVDIAADGNEAIDQLEEARYDLVISDINMPGPTGYEIFVRARHARPPTPVLLITAFGYDTNHSVVRARSEGLDVVLMKPFKVDQLLHAAKQAIQNQQNQGR